MDYFFSKKVMFAKRLILCSNELFKLNPCFWFGDIKCSTCWHNFAICMLKHLLQCLESLQTESKCNWFYRNCLANDGNTSTLSGFSNFSTRSSLKQNWKMTLQSREILIVALKLSIACWKCFTSTKEIDKNFSKWNHSDSTQKLNWLL